MPEASRFTAAAAAAVLLGLEALGIIVVAGWQVVALVSGDVGSPITSLALLAFTMVGALIVGALSAGTARGRSWGRSGGIVTQLLILGVAFGAATGAYAHPLVGLLIAIPAVVTLALLVVASRQAGRAHDERP